MAIVERDLWVHPSHIESVSELRCVADEDGVWEIVDGMPENWNPYGDAFDWEDLQSLGVHLPHGRIDQRGEDHYYNHNNGAHQTDVIRGGWLAGTGIIES